MDTIILASGVALIGAQNQAAMAAPAGNQAGVQPGVGLIQISGFKIGDRTVSTAQVMQWDQIEDTLVAMQGNLQLTSDATWMYYTPDTIDRVKLTCYVSEAIAQFPVGNITLYATYQGVERALCYSANDAQFIKLQTQQPGQSGVNAAPGFEYYFDLMLDVPNLLDRFDFSNLTLRIPEFATFTNEQGLPRALYDEHDDFFIQTHMLTGTPSVVFNSGNHHWGMQNMRPLTAVPLNALEGQS